MKDVAQKRKMIEESGCLPGMRIYALSRESSPNRAPYWYFVHQVQNRYANKRKRKEPHNGWEDNALLNWQRKHAQSPL